MKLRKFFLILGIVLLLSVMVSASDYSDVADTHWASGQISYLSDEIAGYPDGTFQPDKTVTRAEFVSLLARIAFPEELKNETGSTWWEPAFRVCEAKGLLSGTFGYSAPMPRGEIANILGTLCRGSDGVNARADAAEQFVINWNEQRMQSPAWQPMFSDTADFEMFSDALCVCVNQGLLTGYPDGTFRPKNGVTRAEAAVILARLKAQLALRKEGYDYVCTAGSNWLLTKTKGAEASLELMNPLTGDNKLTINFGFKVKTDNLAGWKLFSGSDGTYVWGEAGLYEREGNDIHLVCSEPVLDFVRSGDTYYVLTHPENEYPTYLYAAMYYPCATQVAAVDWDTNMTLLASRDESSNMQNLTDIYAENGKVYVAGAYCMGMMDVHCALYEVTDGKLTALFGES